MPRWGCRSGRQAPPIRRAHFGLSKLTRQVRLFAGRFSVQERIGQQLADGPERILAPHGVAVHWEAEHLCTQMPGVMEIESSARTTFWRADQAELGDLRGASPAVGSAHRLTVTRPLTAG